VKTVLATFATAKVADAGRLYEPQPLWRLHKTSPVPLVGRPTQPVAVVAAALAQAAIATFAIAIVVRVRTKQPRHKDDNKTLMPLGDTGSAKCRACVLGEVLF